MLLYKYRDLSRLDADSIERTRTVLSHGALWAARVDSLNDPDEFKWSCDYSPTGDTSQLLARVLHTFNGTDPIAAQSIAHHALATGRIRAYAEPVIQRLIAHLRSEVGLICFGQSPQNDLLWHRYGGDGDGIAIELEIHDGVLGKTFHKVRYSNEKRVHIDEMFRGALPGQSAALLYEVALLTKSRTWAPEEEIRFVAAHHSQLVPLRITAVVTGTNLSNGAWTMLQELAVAHCFDLRAR